MAKLDITVARGADWSKVLTFKDKSGVAVDLSAALSSFKGQMKKKDGTTPSSFSFSFVTNGTDGKIRATLPSTQNLLQTKEGAYSYDIHGTILTRKYRILWGAVDFQLNVTELP